MKRFKRPAVHAALALVVLLSASVFLPGCINSPTVNLTMTMGGFSYGTPEISGLPGYQSLLDAVLGDFFNGFTIPTPSSPEIPLTMQGIRDKAAEALGIPSFLLGFVKPRLAEISYVEIISNEAADKADLTHITNIGLAVIADQTGDNAGTETTLLNLSANGPDPATPHILRMVPKDKKSANLFNQIKARGTTTGTVHAEATISGKVPVGIVTIDKVVISLRAQIGIGLF